MQARSNIRIDPLDPNTNQPRGNFPILSASQLTRTLSLSRIGRWSFQMSVADPALDDVPGSNYGFHWDDGKKTHYLGTGLYLNRHLDVSGRNLNVNAAGALRDLKRQTVLQRDFDGGTDTVNTVLSNIVPLRPGWSLGAVDTMSQPAPLSFWYEDIFDAVALLANTFGVHFREGTQPYTLDFGAFGEDSGIYAIGGDGMQFPPEIYSNPDICAIESVTVAYESDTVVNRLIPFGGGIGTSIVDLSLVEPSVYQPGYPVKSAALPNGQLHYYIEDEASIAQYGLTEIRFLRKDLRPIVSSLAARTFSSNILYEASLATLKTVKDEQTINEIVVRGLAPDRALPGDKITIDFHGVVQTYEKGKQRYLHIDNEQFYILEREDTFGDGIVTRLKINKHAVHEQTTEDLIANAIKGFEAAKIQVQPTISKDTIGPYTDDVDSADAVEAEFSFDLGPETFNIWYVEIVLRGEPFKRNVKDVIGQQTTTPSGGGSTTVSGGGSTTVSGGGITDGTTMEDQHEHRTWVTNAVGGITLKVAEVSGYLQLYAEGLSGWIRHTFTTQHRHSTPDHQHATPDHQHATPNHQHTFVPEISVEYGVFPDTVYPDQLTIRLNGSVIASDVTLSAPDYTYRQVITAHVQNQATLQQNHKITVSAGTGRGTIEFQAKVMDIIQPVQIN